MVKEMTEKISITIVGGGIVGCAIAYELSKPGNVQIALLEQNPSIPGDNQSSRNSGVIHAGIYYAPDTLIARLCVEGNRLLYEFCKEHQVPHKQTGKLVVAVKPWQKEYLEDALKNAQANGVPDVRLISEPEAHEFEPQINCTEGALYVPTSGIIEPVRLVEKLKKLAEENGVYFLPKNKVVDIKPGEGSFLITTEISGQPRESFETEILINAAGLYSDELARLVNPNSPYSIAVARGETAKFRKNKRPELELSGMNIYPAPYVTYNCNGEVAEVSLEKAKQLVSAGLATKTVGVHLTPTLGDYQGNYFDEAGNPIISDIVTIGPAKTASVSKEDYKPLREECYYHEKVSGFFPGLRLEDIELYQTGNMANLKGSSEWIIESDPTYPNCINLIGINSPGLTASLAIAKYV
ncbi:MAG: NAD(P)/FAD-dependent oxidoreductase [Nanoarchaeota archaeon]